jgi:hypothetical protein
MGGLGAAVSGALGRSERGDLRRRVASHQHATRGTGRDMAIIHNTTMSPGKLELLRV